MSSPPLSEEIVATIAEPEKNRNAIEPPANDNKGAPSFFTPLTPFEPSSIPPRPWVIPGFACRGVVTMLAGPAGVAKTTWTLQVAVGLAAGRSDICGFKIPKRQRVAVWN